MGDIQLKGGCSYSETIKLHVPCGIYRLKFPFDWQKEPLWAEWLFSNEFTVQ